MIWVCTPLRGSSFPGRKKFSILALVLGDVSLWGVAVGISFYFWRLLNNYLMYVFWLIVGR